MVWCASHILMLQCTKEQSAFCVLFLLHKLRLPPHKLCENLEMCGTTAVIIQPLCLADFLLHVHSLVPRPSHYPAYHYLHTVYCKVIIAVQHGHITIHMVASVQPAHTVNVHRSS